MKTKILFTAVATLLAAACSDASGPGQGGGNGGGGGAPVPVASVQVSAPAAELDPGATMQLDATPLDQAGRPLSGRAVAWSTDNQAVATVSSSGVVTAHAAGNVTITATSEGRDGRKALTVREVVVAKPVLWVQITPAGDIPQQAGTTRQLTAVAYGENMTVIEGRPVTWTTSNPNVATVSAGGLLEARAPGVATITAQVEGKTATAIVRVPGPVAVARVELDRTGAALAVGDTLRLTARVVGDNGAVLDRTVVWTTTNAAAVTVSAAGRVTAVGRGSATIAAMVDGKSASAFVVVGTWSRRELLSLGDSALPATLYRQTTVQDGVARTSRFEAHGGALEMLDAGGQFKLMIGGWLHVEGGASAPAGIGAVGGYVQELDGTLYFNPAAGANSFRGRVLADGRIEVKWRPQPNAAEVTLLFARP